MATPLLITDIFSHAIGVNGDNLALKKFFSLLIYTSAWSVLFVKMNKIYSYTHDTWVLFSFFSFFSLKISQFNFFYFPGVYQRRSFDEANKLSGTLVNSLQVCISKAKSAWLVEYHLGAPKNMGWVGVFYFMIFISSKKNYWW
jgi:hypothetical protein